MNASPEITDAELVDDVEGPQPTTAALVPVQPIDALIRPVATADSTVAAFAEFEHLKRKLLVPSDYQAAGGGKSFITKSGWRKLSTVMGVSCELVSRTYDRDDQGRITRAEVVIRASAPNGRFQDGLGICDYRERCASSCFNENRNGGICDGFNHFSKSQHDIPATAATRAQNRACSDLFGFGEVSAEEVNGEDAPPPAGFESHEAANSRNALVLEAMHDLDGYRTKGEGGPLPGSAAEKFAGWFRRQRLGASPWTLEQCDAIDLALNDLIPDPATADQSTPDAGSPQSPVGALVTGAPSAASVQVDGLSGSGGGAGQAARSESSSPPAPPTSPTRAREAPPVGEAPPAEDAKAPPSADSAGGPPSTKQQRQRIAITCNNLAAQDPPLMQQGDKAQLVGLITHDRTETTTEITEAEAARMIAALRFLTDGQLVFIDDPDGDGARALQSTGPAGATFVQSLNTP